MIGARGDRITDGGGLSKVNCADVVRSELNKPLGSTAPIYHQPRYGVDWDDQNSGSKSARRPKLIDYWGEREQFGYKPSFTPGATAGSMQQILVVEIY